MRKVTFTIEYRDQIKHKKTNPCSVINEVNIVRLYITIMSVARVKL